MAKKGYIYQGAKPVYWSWSSESALAEAEIEYHDLVSTSLYYANKIKDGKGILDTDTYIVVWTTTPFTITASRGLTVGADIDYVLVQPAGEDRKFVVAAELLASLSEKFGWGDVQVLATYRGQELNYIVTEHPWDTAVDELVILGDHVTTDSGTGIVHTAPGFGEDDYNVGIANGLEVAVTVDERGIMMKNAGPEFEGQFYDKVVPTVIEKLGNLLLAQEEISHSYPFDWRTKKPIIWRAVPQWFASVSKFRQEILDEIDDFKNLNEFFIRKLRPDARPIDQEEDSLVSPTDGVISEVGTISEDSTFIVKNQVYNVQTLVGDSELADKYKDGTYIIIYLSPKNYHRIHFPMNSQVKDAYSLGKYSYPVNNLGLELGDNILSYNYRQVYRLNGKINYTLIPVGAQNVNSIIPTYESIYVKKGEELGYFEFGSTVVLLFEKDNVILEENLENKEIKMGEKIATIL